MLNYGLLRRFLTIPVAMREIDAIAMLELLRCEHAYMPRSSDDQTDFGEPYRPYDVVRGVGVIDVRGVLVHEPTLMGLLFGGERDYASIDRAFSMALADSDVHKIALHVNSPGGEVSAVFDLSEKIYSARKMKPIAAVLNENAYSAAYAIASAAEHIFVPQTGGTGSIGVIAMRLDITGALEQQGIKVHTIAYGANKTDTYPTTPLSKEAEARLRADVDEMGDMFVDLVARNRKLSADAVRKMEAGTFLGRAGIEAGLADDLMTPEAAMTSLIMMK